MLCVCVFVCQGCRCLKIPEEGIRSPGAIEFQAVGSLLVWMLGKGVGCSGRAARLLTVGSSLQSE